MGGAYGDIYGSSAQQPRELRINLALKLDAQHARAVRRWMTGVTSV